MPATFARQTSEPSLSHSSSWLGCQRVSAARLATAVEKRMTTSHRLLVGDDVPRRQQLVRRSRCPLAARTSPGVSEADRMRSTLNVRRALRDSSQPSRYSAWVRADGSIASGRTRVLRGALRRVVDARVVLDLDHSPAGPCLGQDAEHAREALVGWRGRERVDRRLDVLGEHRRQDLGELDERADQLGVVLVTRLGQHARSEEQRRRLVQGQCQRRQEGLALEPEPPLVAPDRQAGVEIHRLDVAVDGPLRDADPIGHCLGRDPVRMIAQDHRDLQIARGAIPLCGAAVVGRVHRLTVASAADDRPTDMTYAPDHHARRGPPAATRAGRSSAW